MTINSINALSAHYAQLAARSGQAVARPIDSDGDHDNSSAAEAAKANSTAAIAPTGTGRLINTSA